MHEFTAPREIAKIEVSAFPPGDCQNRGERLERLGEKKREEFISFIQ